VRATNPDITGEVVDGGLRVRAFALSAGDSSSIETTPRIETAFFMVTDPRLQQLISDATSLD
jgi:hypothetical protein